MVDPKEKWVSLCEFDAQGEICFTQEYLDLTKDIGGHARIFAVDLLTHWDKEQRGLLDYFGPIDLEKNMYDGIDGHPMDIDPEKTMLMEYYELAYEGLDGDFYQDILRAKLVSLKLPERLIKEYVQVVKDNL